ncbi:MAG TPA: hypothetical protein VNJ08_04550 [Bacteriovoracaceae bacterium]|nr:hypothetical protein [Bacteriovoracaceae bacterium]
MKYLILFTLLISSNAFAVTARVCHENPISKTSDCKEVDCNLTENVKKEVCILAQMEPYAGPIVTEEMRIYSKDNCLKDRNAQFAKHQVTKHIGPSQHNSEYKYDNCAILIANDCKSNGLSYCDPLPSSETLKPKLHEKSKPLEYDSSSCEWVEDLPRKIVKAPKSKNCIDCVEICTGYVKCRPVNPDAPMFVRISTCDKSNCTKDSAKACTQQQNYYSVKPADGVEEVMTEEMRKAVGITK